MSLLDGALAAVFGAALAPLFLNGILHKVTDADTGAGGFAPATQDYPVKVAVEALSDRARAASGFPDPAVRIDLLAAGLAVQPDLDDLVTVSGRTYRIIRVDTDPAGAAFALVAVPA